MGTNEYRSWEDAEVRESEAGKIFTPKYAIGDHLRYLGKCSFEPTLIAAGDLVVISCVPECSVDDVGQWYYVNPEKDMNLQQIVSEEALGEA
jgi:hypothetical protein